MLCVSDGQFTFHSSLLTTKRSAVLGIATSLMLLAMTGRMQVILSDK